MKKKAVIYALVDPRTNSMMYVGKTKNPKQRYLGHLSSRYANKKKLAWIDELKESGRRPIMVKLEECDHSVWREREMHWMYVLEYGQKCPDNLPVLMS